MRRILLYSIKILRWRGGGKKIVEIFWTGGFDSTFRIIQLSRCDIIIQPYYISDNRISEKNELDAIKQIILILKENSHTHCIFRDLIIVNIEERIEIPYITYAWNDLRKTDFFGSQYEWLASFAVKHEGIELSVHEDDKAVILINKYGKLKKIHDQIIGDYYIVDKSKSNQKIVALFGDYHLPLITWTKLEMKKYYLDNGYKDVMNLTWFCYNPINGKPCGTCNPCMYTIEEGMEERFSNYAIFRYHCKKFLIKFPFYNAIKKIKHLITHR